MKYCKNCGKPMQDDDLFCRSCGSKQETVFEGFSDQPGVYNTYYDDAPPRRLNKTMQTFIKVFLILAIISVVLGAGRYLLTGLSLNDSAVADAVISELETDPEFVELVQSAQIDTDQIIKVVQIVYIVIGVMSLIPLCWVLPMRKKIVNAMRDGTTLSTGFKVCTLIFVSVVTGILLLCSKEI